MTGRTETDMEKVRLGIIGIGNMGSGHANSIVEGKVPGMELLAVADLRESRRAWAKENLPETVRIFEEGDELIDSGWSKHWKRGFMRSVKSPQGSIRNRSGK